MRTPIMESMWNDHMAPFFILIELWIGFSKYDLTKTQSRIMPGVSKLEALLKRLLREVNYTA